MKRADIRVDFPIISGSSQPSAPLTEKETGPSVEHIDKGRAGQKTLNIPGVQVTDLMQADFIEPPLKLEKEYKGTHLEAVIQQDGSVVFDGQPYSSLSTAAGMARKSVIGAPPDRKFPHTNEWVFWKYRDPKTGNLEEIDVLRQRYLNVRTTSK